MKGMIISLIPTCLAGYFLNDYLDYLKFQKNYSDYTIESYENDINEKRLHHEIYMSDARTVAPEKWKTVIRHPSRERVKIFC